jgi:hypothetical protein
MRGGVILVHAGVLSARPFRDYILLTFHKIISGCETGDRQAWCAFLSDYTPVMVQLARLHLAAECDPLLVWREAVVALCDDDFRLLRSFEHQSEPEFLADLRASFLERELAKLDRPDKLLNNSGLDPDSVGLLVKDLPLLHQELVFLKLAGYSDGTLEQMFRIAPAVAQKALERLQENYSPWLGLVNDVCPRPQAWLKLMRELQVAKTESCPTMRLFLRIQDGQVGWYEKEPAEKHLWHCLHCLEAWTALREIRYWRVAAPRVSSQDVEALSSAVPARTATTKRAPFFKHIFSRKELSRRG